jgi:hypothetical protein
MIRTLRAVVAVLVLCLFAGSCQVLSWSMDVPAQASVGSVVAMVLTGTTTVGWTGGDTTAVVQLPDGFEVVGAYAEAMSSSSQFVRHVGGGTRDDANVLANYTAEPGHFLTSFYGSGPSSSPGVTSVSVTLKVYVRVPAVVGLHQVKLALGSIGNMGQPPYVHQLPAGITDFASITMSSHVRTVQLLAVPPPPPFTLEAMETWDTPNAALGFAMGDLDGDGRDDFVEVESTQLRAYLTRDTGLVEITGSLASPPLVSNVDIADFDGDGLGDLLVQPPANPPAQMVIYGSGGPQWTPGPTLAAAGYATKWAIADMNADGLPDVLLEVAGTLSLHRSNENRTFTAMPAPPSGAMLLVADLDGDRVAELLLRTAAGAVQLWRIDGLGNWIYVGDLQFGGVVTPNTEPYLAIDLDGNGGKELIRSGSSVGYRYVGQALLPIWAQPLTFQRALAMDYDRDGLDDIVTSQNSGLQLLHNSFGGFFANVPLPSSAGFRLIFGPALLAAVDIDGDSFPDLAVQATEGPMIWRNTMTGAGRYGAACAGTGFAAPQLSVLGTVAPGQSVTLQLTGALPNGPALVWAGLSKRTWAGLPLLPLGLDFVGAAGCELLAEPSVIVPKTADASGLITHVLPLPSLLPTDTLTFFLQGAVFAPGANAFPFLFSQGLALKMQ